VHAVQQDGGGASMQESEMQATCDGVGVQLPLAGSVCSAQDVLELKRADQA